MDVLIITGGGFEKSFALEYIKKHKFDYVITADQGFSYAMELGVKVSLILGDFDSLDGSILDKYRDSGIEILQYPAEKDFTDTHLAIETAIDRGADKITLLCATGSRMDHTIANIGLILLALKKGVECEIVDSNNRIRLIDKGLILKKEEQWGQYVSLIPFTQKVTGITLTGFKYPLYQAELALGVSHGISNEVVEQEGQIQFEEGILLLIESRD